MKQQSKPASFAFKLAEKQKQTTGSTVWTVRAGVSAIGCTGSGSFLSISAGKDTNHFC